MNTIAKPKAYTILVREITSLYNRAHRALVESYWEIGRLIVEQEQQGEDKAEYGARLLVQLSEDLQHRLGSGFSKSNLRNMRRFYLDNRIHQHAGELNWSQHVELLPVTSETDKRRLERRIIRDKLSRSQIRQEVHLIEKDKVPSPQDKIPVVLPEPGREQPLQCFELIAPDRAASSKGTVIVDCGFNIWREIPRQDAALHKIRRIRTQQRSSP